MAKKNKRNIPKGNGTNRLKSLSTGVPTPSFEEQHIAFNFKDFDATQCPQLEDWCKQNSDNASNLLMTIRDYSRMLIKEIKQQPNRFKIYHSFPPNSKFKIPKHLTEDAEWAAFHLKGVQVIAGHLIDNVFYVVFIDDNHDFWPMNYDGKSHN